MTSSVYKNNFDIFTQTPFIMVKRGYCQEHSRVGMEKYYQKQKLFLN